MILDELKARMQDNATMACPECGGNGTVTHTDRTIRFDCGNCDWITSIKEDGKINNRFTLLLDAIDVPQDIRDRFNAEAEKKRSGINFQMINGEKVLQWPRYFGMDMPKDSFKFNSSWRDHAHYLLNRGFRLSDVHSFHVSKESKQEMNDRVILPHYDYDGQKIIGWTARYIWNIPEGSTIPKIVSKVQKRCMYGLEHLRGDQDHLFVVESPFDAKLLGSAVALCMQRCGKLQQEMLKASGKQIIVVPDSDEVGQILARTAQHNGWKIARLLSGYKDPCEMAAGLKNNGRACTADMVRDYCLDVAKVE